MTESNILEKAMTELPEEVERDLETLCQNDYPIVNVNATLDAVDRLHAHIARQQSEIERLKADRFNAEHALEESDGQLADANAEIIRLREYGDTKMELLTAEVNENLALNHELAVMQRDDLICTEFQYKDQFYDLTRPGRAITIHRMISPFYSGEKWAARQHVYCLRKSGEWEVEPQPSSRNDAFYKRCRFDSIEDILCVIDRARAKQNAAGGE